MTTARPSPLRVLVVEPDDAVAALLVPLLEGHGAVVERVREGLRGFVRLQDEPIESVWLAWHGLDVDGAVLGAMIRSLERRNGEMARFLLVLGHDSDREEIVASDFGADDYLLGEWLPGEVAWKLRIAREVVALRQQVHAQNSAGGLLPKAQLRAFVAEEVNRVGRRGGWLSLAVLGIPALAGLKVSYGESWTAWFAAGVWASVRGRLRNYDRMGMLDGGAVCLVTPDLDPEGMGKLMERLGRMTAEYHVAGGEVAQPLQLAARSLSLRIHASYAEFALVADAVWDWVEEQAAAPLPEGVLAFVGKADPHFYASVIVDEREGR